MTNFDLLMMVVLTIGELHFYLVVPNKTLQPDSEWMKKGLGSQLLVVHENSKTVSDATNVGQMVCDFLDGIHLLLQVLGFQEVTEIGILFLTCNLVDF